jgi:hypothetical protein
MCTNLVLIAAMLHCSAGPASAERPPHFDYPIRLFNVETGYVLGPGGNVRIGLGESGFGVRGRMQFTTNLLFDFLTFVNGQVKLGLLAEKGPLPAVAAGFGYYNLASSDMIVGTVLEEAFTEEKIDLSSGLEHYYVFLSMSKRLGARMRFHVGYQYRYLQGSLSSDEAVELKSEGDTLAVYLSLDQTADHKCMMTALDVDLIDHLKVLLELGYDMSYRRGRGGAGVRIGLFQSFNIQAGILWPGLRLDEDIDIPVLPSLTMFWRF